MYLRAVRGRPDRLNRLPEQYFAGLLARVAAAVAEHGDEVIDLGRGNPDVPPPAHVVERLAEVARELGRYEFLFTAAPLRIEMGMGSPLNPIGVF